MENKILFEIVTPERLLMKEWVDEVTAPGSEGEFGVLPGHTPFLTTLKIGEISYRKDRETRYIAVSWGYVEVGPSKITILAETAEMAEEIDIKMAEEARARALAILAKDTEEKEFRKAEATLEKALVRMQVAGKITR
ncbi:MAG: ATP synthase F1 subunit epsilon [Nitrospinae bacterium RIFCSPLOWO2_02_FULL_39_110]|nr:MAG: ATP synthase F1 subunit epsilon [Nitrospinae bacterium RIFCSPHIGHO2_12_FULL_39_42]OGW03076.1 MAG: ATP synthase F1 subunit epsilon [Nitrospinae bacterium RIFCSPHIGHO2_02_FULL_39_82]OGW06669.1 MAG: ATP synthase F1 subunit epsilon [Nitrospinae bacterium RIFCSPLOWO2_02_FULL_39_110]OGW06759.1 MAG: ATP synthase F1 subunit epsilon [Nitrospinae bacterium RIFCSPLOWO2_02_39_17]OGW09357.1 MAG: ATP synthase F1 subunit epsilon [Nitrospinae bacterium RIFCSPLOWO2_12_39_15]OGW11815.1 MAG: ATP synthase